MADCKPHAFVSGFTWVLAGSMSVSQTYACMVIHNFDLSEQQTVTLFNHDVALRPCFWRSPRQHRVHSVGRSRQVHFCAARATVGREQFAWPHQNPWQSYLAQRDIMALAENAPSNFSRCTRNVLKSETGHSRDMTFQPLVGWIQSGWLR